MIRLNALFIAVCMAVIAASLGVLLVLGFGVKPVEAALAALAALMGLALYNASTSRRRDLAAQVVSLSHGAADLAQQVAQQERRLAALEGGDDTRAAAIAAATQPIRAEMRELGALLQQLAEAAAAQDVTLRHLVAAADERAAAAPAKEIAAPAGAPAIAANPAASQAAADDGDASEADAAEEATTVDPEIVTAGPFAGLRQERIVALIREALDDERIDLYLQPIVTLPQRKVRYYEAVMRLRRTDGTVLAAADFLDFAERGGLMPAIDQSIVNRCARVVRRLMAKNRDAGLFCNLSPATLADPVIFPQIAEFLEANRSLANALVFEVRLDALAALDRRQTDNLAALSALGFRLAVDHVTDLRVDLHSLAACGCRFVKIPAELLLSPGGAGGDIDPGDLPGLFARLGIELIADRIEREATVVDLLDFDVKLAQGYLFSPPRPVRPEVMQPEPIAAVPPPAAAKPEPARLPVAADLPPAAAERVSALAQMARRVARNA